MKDFAPYILAIVTAFVGWVSGRRKATAETSKTEIEVVEKAIIIWRTLATDLKKEVDELRSIVNDLRNENEKLKQEVSQIKNSRI